MADSVTRLVVQIGDEGNDREELARLTVALRQELLDLDVTAAERVRGGRPPLDSRAFEVAAVGTLLVTVAKSELLAAIINAVTQWLAHRQARTVKIGIGGDVLELSGLPSGERQRLIDEWLRRHAAVRCRPPAPAPP
jgi:hypothetical protein